MMANVWRCFGVISASVFFPPQAALRRAAGRREPAPGAGVARGTESTGEDATGAAAGGAAGGQDVPRDVGGRRTSQRGAGGAEGGGAAAEGHGAAGRPHQSDGSSAAAETKAQGAERGKWRPQGLNLILLNPLLPYPLRRIPAGSRFW